jgi:hypothetical protein
LYAAPILRHAYDGEDADDMTKKEKETRVAARKRREAWMAEVNQRWAAFVAQRVARPDMNAREPSPGMAVTS